MAFVDWTDEALDGLARHDVWRISHGWEPVAEEIYDAVEAYFRRHDPEETPHFIPGKPARRLGQPVDMRVVLIVVRSKPFKVFSGYDAHVFEIRRVYHPRAKYDRFPRRNCMCTNRPGARCLGSVGASWP